MSVPVDHLRVLRPRIPRPRPRPRHPPRVPFGSRVIPGKYCIFLRCDVLYRSGEGTTSHRVTTSWTTYSPGSPVVPLIRLGLRREYLDGEVPTSFVCNLLLTVILLSLATRDPSSPTLDAPRRSLWSVRSLVPGGVTPLHIDSGLSRTYSPVRPPVSYTFPRLHPVHTLQGLYLYSVSLLRPSSRVVVGGDPTPLRPPKVKFPVPLGDFRSPSPTPPVPVLPQVTQ